MRRHDPNRRQRRQMQGNALIAGYRVPGKFGEICDAMRRNRLATAPCRDQRNPASQPSADLKGVSQVAESESLQMGPFQPACQRFG